MTNNRLIGLLYTGISFKAIGCQMVYHYTVVGRRVFLNQHRERFDKFRNTTCNVAA